MKIRTRFVITMLLFGIILVIIAVSAVMTNQRAEKADEQEKIAASIAQWANDLSYLSSDYLIYREGQQLKRWESKFTSFSNRVASLNVDKPEQKVLVLNIQANTQRLKDVFNNVVSAIRNSSRIENAALDLAFLQVSWSRMAVQSQGLVSDASRLSQLLHRQRDQLKEIRTILMYVMVGLFGLFLLASYMLTSRRILKSIAKLQAGAAVIGSGNLDFAIEEKKNDEIGDLSHAFNRMTTDLKAVTASKADLEREIVDRKKAEEALRQQREWLGVTLSSIGDAVIASDTRGRITFLNPVAVTLTGWQSEEALGQPIQSVFRIINEKTHAPAEGLVERVLNEKRVVGLANDTALVTKDGHEIPIEDSAAPILDSTGNIIGMVLVFHDVTEKRRAQVALREALDRAVWLARFPDENPNPVLRASAEGSILYCNPSSLEVRGWACEVGKPLRHPLVRLVGQAMAEKREVEEDMKLGERLYSVWVTPFPKEGYANVYGRDITARRQAEEALRDAQKLVEADLDAMTRLQKLGTLFVREGNMEAVFAEIVDAAMAISGADFGNIQVLDAKSSDLKIVAQRGFPKWWLDFWDGVSEGQRACGTALERGERVIVQDVEQSPIFVGTPALQIQLKAGVRAIQSTPLVSRTEKPLGMFSTHYRTPHRPDDRTLRLLDLLARHAADIIERAQAEEALQKSEKRYRSYIDVTQQLGWSTNADGEVVEDLPSWRKFTGQSEEEIKGSGWSKALHPDDLEHTVRVWRNAVATRSNYEVEYRIRRHDGVYQHFLARGVPVFKDDGDILEWVGTCVDITERKRAEEALRQRTLELQQLTETLDQQVQERTEELEVANEELKNEIDECQRIEIDLRKSESDLRHLSLELLNAQEKERKLVAGEIHDSIGSSLSAIKFKVVTALTEVGDRSPETTATLQSLIPIVQGVIDEARRIQTNLRPSMLDDLGILVTVRWFCRQFESTYSKIRIRQSIEIEEREVPDFLKTVIFRVLQEGLNNIAKHSGANIVLLSLKKVDRAIKLVIRDNGRGFDLSKALSPDGAARGLGLKNMRERIELSGGSFNIESTVGKGTVIRAWWPV